MKFLVGPSLRRPISVVAFYVLVLVAAGIAVIRLPVQLLPDLRLPTLAIWTGYPDAPPQRVERSVTEPVEQAVGSIAGLNHVTSKSQLGGSLVRLDFAWGHDLDLALLEVREQLDRLGDRLPDEAERPVVLRLDPSDRPILWIAAADAEDENGDAAAGPQATDPAELAQIKRLSEDTVARRLEQLPGVARVRVTGGFDPHITVDLDSDRLHAFGLSVEDVAAAVERGNASLFGGVVRRGPYRYSVEVSGEVENLDELGQMVVSPPGKAPIRLRDLGRLETGFDERRGLVRLDGEEVLLLLVERAADANTVESARAVRETLEVLRQELPGLRLEVIVDESEFIREAIDGITLALVLGGLLASAVLFLFLRRLEPLLAVSTAIPLSLALTLVFFDALDVSINLLSLSGLALGIGMLLDNSIVVVENVVRLRENGLPAPAAALHGTREVATAVTTSTLTTLSVFLPLTFVEGLGGRLFRDQSLAVVVSLLASLLVALTATPLLVSIGRRRSPRPPRSAQDNEATAPVSRLYEHLLALCLRRRAVVVLAALALVSAGGALAWNLPRELVPASDQGRLEVRFELAPESDLPLVSDRAGQIETEARSWPETSRILADLGERDQALLDLDPRPMSEGEVTMNLDETLSAAEARKRLESLDIKVEVRQARTDLERLLLPEEADLLIDLVAERRQLNPALHQTLVDRLSSREELQNVRRASPPEVSAYRLHFDRDVTSRHGVSLDELGDVLRAATQGRQASELRRIGEDVPILLRLPDRPALVDLLALPVPTESGFQPLRRFVDVERVELPSVLWRRDQVAVERLLADLTPGTGLQSGMAAVAEELSSTLPPMVHGRLGGAGEAFRTSLRSTAWSLAMSLLLIYLILAAQFENLLQPLVVIAAVPLALSGMAVALLVTGQSINLMSLTGAVVLTGIVVNDAILKVDRINGLRQEGLDLEEAIQRGGRQRLRPILMTSVTTMAGLLPLVVGSGAGSQLRAPLALTIVGGLVSSTLLTLLVIPVLYSLTTFRKSGQAPAGSA